MKKENNSLVNRSSYEGEQTWKLVHAVRFGSEEEVKEFLKELMEQAGESGISRRRQQMYLMQILNALMHLVWKYELTEKELFPSDENGYEQILRIPMREAELFFIDLSMGIKKQLKDTNEAESYTVRRAISYMEKNYRNPELTVESISRYLHLSQSYFSTIFRRSTGKRFVSFIRDLRLKKAAELLNSTDEKTYIIARNVGYEDPFYFSSIFKKKFGICPSGYRKGIGFLNPGKEGNGGTD